MEKFKCKITYNLDEEKKMFLKQNLKTLKILKMKFGKKFLK